MADNLLQLSLNHREIRSRIGELKESFEPGDSRLNLAGSRAINRTLAHMRTYIGKEIRQTYYVKKQDLDKAISLEKVKSRKVMAGKLIFQNEASLPLINFGAVQNKNFVSVRVLKQNRRRRIMAGGSKKIMATKKGRAAVWIAKGHIFARVEDEECPGKEKDHPIVLYGPSFMSFFGKPSMVKVLEEKAATFMQEKLVHEVENILAGRGLKDFKGK